MGRSMSDSSFVRRSLIHTFSILLCCFYLPVTQASAPEVEMGISEYSKTDQEHSSKRIKKESKSTTDHSRLKELQGPFFSGPEVTKVCLECHNTAGHQFMKK